MTALAFTIPGPPRGKGRPKFARMGSFVRTYTDAKTASYENLVALAASHAHRGAQRLDGPLAMTVVFVMPRPKSAPKRITLPATKPDLDNLVKAVLDGCNQAGVWADDARVVEISARKIYGEPRCEVEIARVSATPAESRVSPMEREPPPLWGGSR